MKVVVLYYLDSDVVWYVGELPEEMFEQWKTLDRIVDESGDIYGYLETHFTVCKDTILELIDHKYLIEVLME